MIDLITINTTTFNGAEMNSVNSRDIYEYLEVESNYSTWFNRAVEKYDFIEGEDFIPVLEESNGGRPNKIYIVTMDMAKELCMISNTPKGKETRKYFINVDKRANKPMTQIEMMSYQMSLMVKHEERLDAIEQSQIAFESKMLSDVTELVEKNVHIEVRPRAGYKSVSSLMIALGMSKPTILKLIDSGDPRTDECSKFVEDAGIRPYTVYNYNDVKQLFNDVMRTAVKVSKHYYESEAIKGKFKVSK